MTSLQRLAAVHKKNEVSWHREVTKPTEPNRQAPQNSSITSQSPSSLQVNKLQHIDPVKYCVRNYSVHKTRKAADVVCFHTEVKHHFVTASFYNITSVQAFMTSPSAMHNKFPILYSLHNHIYGMPLSQYYKY